MRLRNIKGARDVIKDTSFCIKEPENYKGRWKKYFTIIIRFMLK